MTTPIFNWERDGVTDEEMISTVSEMEAMADFTTMDISEAEGWEIFLDHENLKIWRRYVEECSLFEYKVLGTFSDITPRAFYDTQMDLKFWCGWDPNTVGINILDESIPSNSAVVHWVYKYPYPMQARDYCYVRRGVVMEECNSMVIRARAVNHQKCPENPSTVRVRHYQSRLVIRPHTTFDENGLKFYMTYFDNPQSQIPSFCYNWMASSSVTVFVERMHDAAKLMQERKNEGYRPHIFMSSQLQ